MPNTVADEVIQKLQERVTRGALHGITVTYRVTGGAPGEAPVDEELRLVGSGPMTARLRTATAAVRESSETLATPDMQELLLQIGAGAGELIPRSQARFVPDSLVGQLAVQLDGQEAVFCFLADAEQAKQSGQALSPKAANVVNSLMRLHQRLLPREEETS